MRTLTVLIAATLLLSGCAQTATHPFVCGTEDRGHGAEWNAEVRQCFWNAYMEGKQAEFTTSILTEEGDPIIQKVRLLPKGRLEVTVDTTQDKFGHPTITVYTCTKLTATEDTHRFSITGCNGGPESYFQI